MNDSISMFFGIAGMTFAAYAVGRALNNVCLFLEDDGKDGFPGKLLAGIALVFYIIGFPATLIIRILLSYPDKRVQDSIKAEERKKYEELTEIRIQTATRKEREKSHAFFTNLMDEYTDELHKTYRDQIEELQNRCKELESKQIEPLE